MAEKYGPHVERLRAVAASPSRRLVAVGGERDVPTGATSVGTSVHVFAMPKVKAERSIPVDGDVLALCFPSDELLLAGLSTGRILGWDAQVADGDAIVDIPASQTGTGAAVRALVCSPMGEHLAWVDDAGVLRTGKVSGGRVEVVAERSLSGRALLAVAVDPGATTVAAAGDDGVIRTLPLDDVAGAAVREMPCGEGGVYSLAFTGDGRVAAGCGDGSVHLLYLEGAVDDENRSGDAGHTAPVIGLIYSFQLYDEAKRPLERRLFSLSQDGDIKAWVLDTRRRPKTITVSSHTPHAMVLIPAGKGTKADRRGGHLVVVDGERRINLTSVDEKAAVSESFTRVESLLAELKSNLRASSTQVRKDAVQALRDVPEDEARALLDRALENDRKPEVRKLAAEIIGASARRLSRPALRKALDDKDRSVRKAALGALETIEKATPLAPVRAALRSRHPDIRIVATRKLPALRAASPLVPGLIAERLADDSAKVRVAALDALYELWGADSLEPVRIAIARGPADIRKDALLRLGRARKTQEPLGRSLIEGGIDDGDEDVRTTAFLISVGARAGLSALVRTVDEKTRKELAALEREGRFADRPTSLEPTALTDDDMTPLFAALTCHNPDIAMRAARTLGLLGDSRATGALLQLSRESDASVRRQVVEAIEAAALAMPGDDRLGARLEWLLDDDDGTVRSLAFDALTKLAEPDGAEGLMNMAALALSCAREDVRMRALPILVKFGGKGPYARLEALATRADTLLGDALDDESSRVRTEAFNTLWAWHSKDPEVPLTRGAGCRHADVRQRVVAELARLKKRPAGEWADAALLRLVRDTSAEVGKAAYEALTDKKANKADDRKRVEVHRAALESPRASVRAAGCKGTPRSAAKDLRSRLVALVRDEDASVHIAAIEAIDRVAPKDAEGFAAAFASVYYGLRARACELCGKRRDTRAVAPCKELLTISKTHISPPSANIRQRAARALADVGDHETIPFYLSLLDDEDGVVREMGSRGLATACRPGDEESLVGALSHADLAVRSWAAEGLARLGDTRALPVLAGTLSHDHRPIRLGAIMGFVALGPDGVRGILQGLEDGDREIQDLVFAVIVARDIALARAGKTPDLLLSATASSTPEIRFAAARILESRIAGEELGALAQELVGPRRPDKASDMKDWPEEAERKTRLDVLIDALASDHPAQRYAATQVLSLRAQPLSFWREADRLIGPSAANRPRIPFTNWESDEQYQPRKQGWIRSLFKKSREREEVSATERVLAVIKYVGAPTSRAVPSAGQEFTDAHARRLAFGTYAGLIRQAPARGESDQTHRVRRDSIDRLAALALANDVGRDAVLPVLRRALSDPHHLVRKAAVNALGSLYATGSHEPHRLALQASAADVGRAAVDALVASALAGDEPAAKLAKGAIDAPVAEVRAYAMAQMQRLFDSDSMEPWLIALSSRYADIRLSVVDRLVDSTDARVPEALGRAMESDHDDLRLKAAVALARRGDVRTVDVLAGILRSEDARTAKKATDALIALAHARPQAENAAEVAAAAAETVAARIEDDPDRTADRNALMDALGRIGSPAAGEVLLGLMADDDGSIRSRALDTLMTIAVDHKRGARVYEDGTRRQRYHEELALEYLGQAVRASDITLRERAVEVLRDIDDAGAEALLGRLIEDREESVRVAACEALAFRAQYVESATIDALSSTLRGGRRELVLPAAVGLASRKRPEAFQALLLVFKASEQADRERAVLALGTLGDRRALEELEVLVDAKAELEDEDRALAPTAIEALGRMLPALEDSEEFGPELSRVREVVERTAYEGAPNMRVRALTGLRHAGQAGGEVGERARALLERTAADEHDDTHVRTHAVNELGLLGHEGSETVLADLLNDPNYGLRSAALASLERIFPRERTRTSLLALDSRYDAISAPAAGFLARRGDPAVLVARLADIKSEDVRARLRRGLMRRKACPMDEVRAVLTGDRAGPRADVAWLAGSAGAKELADATAAAVTRSAEDWARAKNQMASADDDKARRQMADAEAAWTACLWASHELGADMSEHARLMAPERNTPTSVRTQCLRILATRGKASDVAAIQPCLSDPSAEIRVSAASTVAALAPDWANAVLDDLAVADAAAMRPIVRAALGADEGAAERLLGVDTSRQLVLPTVLGERRTEALTSVADRSAGAADGKSRLTAIASLGRVGGDDARDVLQKILDDESENDAARATAFKALRRLQRRAERAARYQSTTEEANA